MCIQPKTAIALVLLSGSVMAEDTNYGDPTASYRGLGVQRTNDGTQVSGVFGTGEHIASADFGLQDNGKDYNYRVRYFNVDQDNGFGVSVDLLGNNDSTGLLGGMVQKFALSDNVIIVPMLAAGMVTSDLVAQGGLYGMYAFDSGHWLYANPKTTYLSESKAWTKELELGGGYMLTDVSSLGFKYETKTLKGVSDRKAWVNLYYYF